MFTLYIIGVVMGLLTMTAGTILYDMKVSKIKPDMIWTLKISLLSWVTVYFGMLLLKETLNKKRI
jgi:hypothetical protein